MAPRKPQCAIFIKAGKIGAERFMEKLGPFVSIKQYTHYFPFLSLLLDLASFQSHSFPSPNEAFLIDARAFAH